MAPLAPAIFLNPKKRARILWGVAVFTTVFFLPAGVLTLHAAQPKKRFFVRVLVSQERTYLMVSSKKGAVLRFLPSGQTTAKPIILNQARLVGTPNGFRLGRQERACQAISIEPLQDRDLYLDDTRFRGFVTVRKQKNGLMYAVNRLDIESYLYGVLHHE